MKTPSLSTAIAGIPFPSFLGNASGARCTASEELFALGASRSGSILIKSCTIEAREGNRKPRYAILSNGDSIQSMGLPNSGYREYLKMIPDLKKFHKPVIASVSGFSLDEYIVLVSAFQESDVDLIEVNLSCPNIEGKPQVGYDIRQVREVLEKISSLGNRPFGLKLPPYFDLVHFDEMARVISQYPVGFITCINSLGNGLVLDPISKHPRIQPKGGLGGVGGRSIKPFALGNVFNFRSRLPSSIDIIGVGGIASGDDALEFLLVGASAVQVGTTLQEEGISCFSRIEEELQEILLGKGCYSLDDVKEIFRSGQF